MLRGIYAPTDLDSINLARKIPKEVKLAEIAESAVTIEAITQNSTERQFLASLPYTSHSYFFLGLVGSPSILYSEYISIGDEALYGNGIGTRILGAAVRYAIERKPQIDTFSTNWARLGLVNTAVKVLGLENVGVDIEGERYGWQGEQPLEAMFDFHPAKPGDRYLVNKIVAHIDRSLLPTWETPDIY